MLEASAKSFAGSPFEYDVFMSYAHGDPDGAGTAPLVVWSQQLVEELKQDIKSTTVEFDNIQLCDDRDVDRTRKLTGMLKERVSGSALLLIVMSPRYLNSPWCKDELQWFAEELRRRDLQEGCTLVVRALPTPEEEWPDLLKDERGHAVIGFWFHPRPPTEGARAFGWPKPTHTDREFYKELSRLSTTVQERLKKLKEQKELRAGAEKGFTAPGPNPKVYLHARQKDFETWQEIRRQLIGQGYRVYPESLKQDYAGLKGLPLLEEQRRRRVEAYLDCDVVLVLRPEPGDWIDRELETVGFDEIREVDAFHGKQIPCAVLDFINDGAMQATSLNITRFSDEALWLSKFSRWLTSLGKEEPRLVA
ncbi:MAG TPA: toll/interleukin-1 receptor domain-containing protein [Beijerinckiaceae bacterium]